ncbi:hypothetical protein GCM10009557_63690 [Virgisporangium ochraceum]|uniref:Uncharacterized protein n=1 Tax=Virgisporangium ochraceum TaxID=65505 RepID=A0A8J4A0G0_9ACTN|nr:hypothetical protein [Virgisporangium ochraceum]GIJ72916.1 hypothetical protein Voc01_078330 [Virgisporangium ochraceum]
MRLDANRPGRAKAGQRGRDCPFVAAEKVADLLAVESAGIAPVGTAQQSLTLDVADRREPDLTAENHADKRVPPAGGCYLHRPGSFVVLQQVQEPGVGIFTVDHPVHSWMT